VVTQDGIPDELCTEAERTQLKQAIAKQNNAIFDSCSFLRSFAALWFLAAGAW
jgi:hypothetical protein